MSKIYVVNEPLKRGDGGKLGRFMNLEPAEEHGQLVHLLEAGHVPRDPCAMQRMLVDGLKDFTREDALLPLGDITAVAIAAGIVAVATDGHFNLLRWNRSTGSYTKVEVEL